MQLKQNKATALTLLLFVLLAACASSTAKQNWQKAILSADLAIAATAITTSQLLLTDKISKETASRVEIGLRSSAFAVDVARQQLAAGEDPTASIAEANRILLETRAITPLAPPPTPTMGGEL